MNAQEWHDYCVSIEPQEPRPHTIAEWKRMTPDQRQSYICQLRNWLGYLYVETDELVAISKIMTRTVEDNVTLPPGAKKILGLTGCNLAGKSRLMMRWGRDQYNEWRSDVEHDSRGRPIIRPAEGIEIDLCRLMWLDMSAGAKIAKFDATMLIFLCLSTVGLLRELEARALAAVKRHGVRAVIVDDAHFVDVTSKPGRAVLDHIKHLNTALGQIGGTLILVGANLAGTELLTDPQIAGRLTLESMPVYEIRDPGEQETWQRIVRSIEVRILPHLPRGKPGMLYTELAGELWLRTQGYLGDLADLVRKATLAAREDGTHRIIRRHLDIKLNERADAAYQARVRSPAEYWPANL